MNEPELDNVIANSWERDNWAMDEEWVRAAAALEAETGVDFLIGADLGNTLDNSSQIIPERIDVARLSGVLEDGLMDLLSPAELSVLVTDTRAYISDRVQQLRCERA
jgi:hypothetical protein